MISDLVAYLKNPFLDRLWKRGFEEIIGPLGPLRLAEREGPHPEPWKEAVSALLQAAVAKDLAARYQNKAGQQSASQTIDNVIDDWCGTPPRKLPWPFPGPPPWTWQIASELSLVANSLQDGSLRKEVEGIVGQLARGKER